MTDNEIIETMPFLAKYCKKEYNDVRVDEVLLGAYDILNRQKAEIEEWKKILESRHRVIDSLEDSIIGLPDQIRAEAVKKFAERLKENFNNLEYKARTTRKTVKTDELREQIDWVLHMVAPKTIDNLVKEMVGEG